MTALPQFTTSELHRLAAGERRAAAGMRGRIDIKAQLLDRCPPKYRDLVEQHIAKMGPPPRRRRSKANVAKTFGDRLGITWDTSTTTTAKSAVDMWGDAAAALVDCRQISAANTDHKQRAMLRGVWNSLTTSPPVEDARTLLIEASSRWPRLWPLLRLHVATDDNNRELILQVGRLLELDR